MNNLTFAVSHSAFVHLRFTFLTRDVHIYLW